MKKYPAYTYFILGVVVALIAVKLYSSVREGFQDIPLNQQPWKTFDDLNGQLKLINNKMITLKKIEPAYKKAKKSSTSSVVTAFTPLVKKTVEDYESKAEDINTDISTLKSNIIKSKDVLNARIDGLEIDRIQGKLNASGRKKLDSYKSDSNRISSIVVPDKIVLA